MTNIEWIEVLRNAVLADNPPVDLIYDACFLLVDLDLWYADEDEVKEKVPDWVMALANGNPDCWDDVVKVVRKLIEVCDDNDNV